MKIAHLVSTFPPHPGGMGQVCLEEAKRLAPEHEVTVFTLAYKNTGYSDGGLNFRIERLIPMFQFGDAGLIAGLVEKLRGFDIVHLHYPFYGAIGAVIRAKKMLGFSLAVTYHMDAQSTGLKRFIAGIYDAFFSKRIFKIADKVIGVDSGYFSASKYGRFIGKEKSVILPNGVDTEIYSPGSPGWDLAGLPPLIGKKVLLFVGNLLQIKNLDLLLRIMPALAPDVCLLVAGGGYDMARYKQIIQWQNLAERVFFSVGFNESDLRAYYRSADIVCVPSLSESFSLVALSAMSCGAVVLASDIPGLRGRIDNNNNGFLAKVNLDEDWKSSIVKILNLSVEEKRSISSSARAAALAYSWENHLKKLNEIYLSV